MKIVFMSNYLNHHQHPLCQALYKLCDGDFRFVACAPINSERLSLGYEDLNAQPFVIRAYEGGEQLSEAIKWCMESNVAIHGSAWKKFARMRIDAGLPLFRYSERIFKEGLQPLRYPVRFFRFNKNNPKKAKVYMLCASAYTAADYAKFGLFRGKAYRWGYFPEVKQYENIEKITEWKRDASILWVARLIECKHPELPVILATRLKAEGYRFNIDIIGNGKMEEDIRRMIKDSRVEDCVHMLGSMPPEKVREHMEQSEIFLFTSDRNEGWGAVLNESMNSACAVVASHAIGSVPFLIKDGENGLIYKDGDVDSLYSKVKFLLDNSSERKKIGISAYNTLTEQWNAENAAKRFIDLAEAVISGDNAPDIFADGVCSKAPILKENWYKNNCFELKEKKSDRAVD